jgi:hypothetical protein
MSLPRLHEALQPLLTALANGPLDAAALEKQFPVSSPQLQALKKLVREGVDARWLCDRENGGVRFSRVLKADPARPLSVDAVHMSGPGAGHTHPSGEIDLCFAVSGDPRFDGRPEGWTVYAPGTWHVPTVSGGVMDILYFLPGGAIRFEPKPA